jgi:hypothetical protein
MFQFSHRRIKPDGLGIIPERERGMVNIGHFLGRSAACVLLKINVMETSCVSVIRVDVRSD